MSRNEIRHQDEVFGARPQRANQDVELWCTLASIAQLTEAARAARISHGPFPHKTMMALLTEAARAAIA